MSLNPGYQEILFYLNLLYRIAPDRAPWQASLQQLIFALKAYALLEDMLKPQGTACNGISSRQKLLQSIELPAAGTEGWME
jgi:hypothetical protein